MPPTLLTDRIGLLGTAAGLLAGLPPEAVYGYLLARLLIPVLLIVLAAHGATPGQRVGLVRDYLIGREHPNTPSGRPNDDRGQNTARRRARTGPSPGGDHTV